MTRICPPPLYKVLLNNDLLVCLNKADSVWTTFCSQQFVQQNCFLFNKYLLWFIFCSTKCIYLFNNLWLCSTSLFVQAFVQHDFVGHSVFVEQNTNLCSTKWNCPTNICCTVYSLFSRALNKMRKVSLGCPTIPSIHFRTDDLYRWFVVRVCVRFS